MHGMHIFYTNSVRVHAIICANGFVLLCKHDGEAYGLVLILPVNIVTAGEGFPAWRLLINGQDQKRMDMIQCHVT